MQTINLRNVEYTIVKLIGKGKGGYSYLATDGTCQYVLKKIHHEPCEYYQFGDKMQSELKDYATLQQIGVPLPKLLAYDLEQEFILKEYIKGDTIYELIVANQMKEIYITEMKKLCKKLYENNLNIDYFPTNFVVNGNHLFYIDYECNTYMEEWNFENWGIRYWSKTEEFIQYQKEHRN